MSIENDYVFVPIEKAIVPAGRDCIVNRYWLVRNETDIVYYQRISKYTNRIFPQCNPDIAVGEQLLNRFGLDKNEYSVLLIPVVFTQNVYKHLDIKRPLSDY